MSAAAPKRRVQVPSTEPLAAWLRAFAQTEGRVSTLARESGRGNAHFGLDAAGHVILSAENGDGGSNADHASYAMSHHCAACHYDAADDPARVDADGAPRPLPNSFTAACERCGHPPLAFPPRSPR